MFTGSGMPMRFADLDGSLIDVYQAATQMTDESGQSYPLNIDSLLDKALGPEGYYGVFTANMHTDNASIRARTRSSPRRSRGACRSSPPARCSTGSTAATAPPSTRCPGAGTRSTSRSPSGPEPTASAAMVPTTSAVGRPDRRDAKRHPIPTTTQTIKGVHYAFFDAAAGSYEATYAVDDDRAADLQPRPGGPGQWQRDRHLGHE